MVTINVGSVVLDAELSTAQFERGLASLVGLAQDGLGGLAPPDLSLPDVTPPDLSGLDGCLQASGMAAAGLRAGVDGLIGALGGLFTAAKTASPAFDELAAAQGRAHTAGAAASGGLGGLWAGFRDLAAGAAAEVAGSTTAAADTAAAALAATGAGARTAAGLTAAAMSATAAAVSESNAASLTAFGTYSQGLQAANLRLTNGIKATWSGTTPFFAGLGKTVANGIIGTINGLSAAVTRGICGLLGGLSDSMASMAALFGLNWSFKLPPQPPAIPYLARGGVVSAPTLAMVGERGKEAVLPLENNTGWMNALAEKLSAAAAPQNGGGATAVHLYVDGKRLAEATIADFRSVAGRRGIALVP